MYQHYSKAETSRTLVSSLVLVSRLEDKRKWSKREIA